MLFSMISRGISAGSVALGLLCPMMARAQTYTVIHSFGADGDGDTPYAALLNDGGTLYGVTTAGGKHKNGTIFSLSPQGVETVLASFLKSGKDGFDARDALARLGDSLYGTTESGGASYQGTIFELKGHRLKSIYSFNNGEGADTADFTGLERVGQALYGTELSSGTHHDGAIYVRARHGSPAIIYSFSGGTDGGGPVATLLNVDGTLYGTTTTGGAYNSGTVFSLTTDGTEKTIYAFNSASGDGSYSESQLLRIGHTLFGTSGSGGKYGYGTIYSVTLAGVERVLYAFPKGAGEAVTFNSNLVNIGDILYGTTYSGGADGCGTIYAIGRHGKPTTLHSFAGGSDGCNPFAGLTKVNGTLYGTTLYQGANRRGGTVFSITP